VTPQEKAQEFLKFRSEKQKEMRNVSSDKEKRQCELCGQTKPLSSSYEMLVCSTCMNLLGSAKLRPEATVKALRYFHGSLVPFISAEESKQVVEIAGIVQPADGGDTAAQALSLKCAEHENTISGMTARINELTHDRSILTTKVQALNAEDFALKEFVKELQKSLLETTKKLEHEYESRPVMEKIVQVPAPGIDKAKLFALLAEIGQGIIEARMKLSARVYRELRKLAA